MGLEKSIRPSTHILLVEDSPSDVRLLTEYLHSFQDHSFEVTAVDRISAALEFLQTSQVDLILLDLMLPDSRGMQTINHLLAGEMPVPVIVLTGLYDDALAIEAMRLGAQDYLVKSQINRSALLKSILYSLERARVLEALRISEERYALAALAANDGLWDWDLGADTIYYSPRWCGMLGLSLSEVRSSPDAWFDRVHQDDLPRLRWAIRDHLQGNNRHFEVEYRIQHSSGSYRWMLCRGAALFDGKSRPYRVAGSQSDITARKLTEQRLLHEVQHDSLTQLPNRVLFRQRLQAALARFQSGELDRFAVLFIDLDRFKMINDSLGHMAGDQLLTAIARRLENCVPPGTTIARLGGDEFAVLLDAISVPADALRVARRILTSLEHPFQVQHHQVFSTGCIGIALSNSSYCEPYEILRDADTAMYRAKAQGTGQYQVFDKAMHTRALAMWRLETELREAIERQEFNIHFQSIVSLDTGRLAGFEALVRWNHPTRGLLYPADFLSVADESGLLATIDRWMILNSVRQLREWSEHYPGNQRLFVSLNLSDRLMKDGALPDYIESVLKETGAEPHTLKLEITETVINNEIDRLRDTLSRLKEMGIKICLDDFGTGYSSLESLSYYNVDVLKIAAPFVAAMVAEGSGLEIVRTIITLAHDLNLQVIAEGVETPQQLALLQTMGCEFGQGHYFAQSVRHASDWAGDTNDTETPDAKSPGVADGAETERAGGDAHGPADGAVIDQELVRST